METLEYFYETRPPIFPAGLAAFRTLTIAPNLFIFSVLAFYEKLGDGS
jgi:hypothetical protein